MSARGPQRDAPALRDLLSRATWADLDRIAARYAVSLSGRRRELAVERLAALLERPDQLLAAERVVPESTRAVLGLLMLLGSTDDEQALAAARERLLAARPDVHAALGRVHLTNEVQMLMSLGLCFGDRRRLIVPSEVLAALPNRILAATPGLEPAASVLLYAGVAFKLNSLLVLLAETPPVVVQSQRAGQDRGNLYQPLLLTSDAAAELGQRLKLPPAEVVLLLALLEALNAVSATRGRWQVQEGWHSLASHAPRHLLAALITAWQQPRALSDLGRTGQWSWRVGPDIDGGSTIAAHEAALRVMLWRCLRWASSTPLDITSLGTTLAALHPRLFQAIDERTIWIAPAERSHGAAVAMIEPAVAQAVVRELLQQLALLGLVVLDRTSCKLSPLALALMSQAELAGTSPVVASDGSAVLRVQPLLAPPELLRMIGLAGRMLPPDGEYACYEIEPRGLVRLQQQGLSVAAFQQTLEAAGAQLQPRFTAQLTEWEARAGRVKLHQPLAVLLTAEDAPLQQILAAAGAADAAEIIGPGCALLEPERVPAAVEQLRARGFWPTTLS